MEKGAARQAGKGLLRLKCRFPRRPVGTVAVDYETTGLDVWNGGARPFMLGLEDEAGNVMLAEPGTPQWQRALAVLADPSVEKVCWNAKYEMSVSLKEGIDLAGPVHDAMLMCYMNDEYEPDLKLKGVGRRHFGDKCREEEEIKPLLAALKRAVGRKAYELLPRPLVRRYLEKDLDLTVQSLWRFGHVREQQPRVYGIENGVIPHVVEMERWGVHVDTGYCRRMMDPASPDSITSRKAALRAEMERELGCPFNPSSNPQLADALAAVGVDTGRVNERGEMSGSRELLEPFAASRPLVRALLEWRSLAKLDSTYFAPFLEMEKDGVIHPSFWPFGSEDRGIKTGRFSCRKPNFQNLPKDGRNAETRRDKGVVRRAVTPRPGYAFLFGDYSQIEYKIFACNTGDEALLERLRKGEDFHKATALITYGEGCFDGKTPEEQARIRSRAKNCNFALLFGAGDAKYAATAGISIEEARHNRAEYFRRMPLAREYLMKSQGDLLSRGYVEDVFGRRYHVPKDQPHKAGNVLCQGPAALVNKRGLRRVGEALRGLDAHIFVTVHDEIGVEVRREQVRDAAAALEEGMLDGEDFPIPMQAELAVAEESWAVKRKWDAEEAKKWTSR